MKNRLGESPRRKEDMRLLMGRGQFADDNNATGQGHAVMVPSVHAHAIICGIDKTAALSAPGVIEVLTGADWLADGLGAIPHNLGFSSPPDIALHNRHGSAKFVAPHYQLPADRARLVGEPVASPICLAVVVVTRSAGLARPTGVLSIWRSPGRQPDQPRPSNFASQLAGLGHTILGFGGAFGEAFGAR